MPASNKDRVYVALYARGGQDPNTYHWAIVVGPKEEVEGGRAYARQRFDPARPGHNIWVYESLEIPLIQTSMLLGRIMIAKVTNSAQLHSTLAAVPIVQDDPSWTCRIWVKDAISALEADRKSLGTRITDWTTIEQTILSKSDSRDDTMVQDHGYKEVFRLLTFWRIKRPFHDGDTSRLDGVGGKDKLENTTKAFKNLQNIFVVFPPSSALRDTPGQTCPLHLSRTHCKG